MIPATAPPEIPVLSAALTRYLHWYTLASHQRCLDASQRSVRGSHTALTERTVVVVGVVALVVVLLTVLVVLETDVVVVVVVEESVVVVAVADVVVVVVVDVVTPHVVRRWEADG